MRLAYRIFYNPDITSPGACLLTWTTVGLTSLLISACAFNIHRPTAPNKTLETNLGGRVQVINPDYTGGLYDHQNKQYILWGTDGVISRSKTGKHWLQHSMGSSETLRQLVVYGSELLAVGDNNTLLESEDTGRHWRAALHPKIPGDYFTALIRENGDRLIAGTQGQLLFRSKTRLDWQLLPVATASLHTLSENLGTVFLGGGEGFLATSNNARDWRVINTGTASTISRIVASGSLVVALTEGGSFLLSRNNGQSWSSFDTGFNAPLSAAAFSSDQGKLVVAAQTGQTVYADLTSDLWHQGAIKLKGNPVGITNLIYDQTHKRFLASGDTGLFAWSRDDGASWTASVIKDSDGIQTLLFNHHQQQLLTFGRGGEIHIAENASYNWQTVQQNLSGYYRVAKSFAKNRVTLGTVGEVIISEPTPGNTAAKSIWRKQETPYLNEMTPPHFRSLITLPSQVLLAAGPTGAIMKSLDFGLSWKTVLWTPFDFNDTFTQLLHNDYNQSVFAIEVQGRFYISDNAGESWRQHAIQTPNRLWHGDVNPNNGVTVIVGQQGQTAVYTPETDNWALHQIPDVPDLYGCFYSKTNQAFILTGENGTLLTGSGKDNNWRLAPTHTTSTLRGTAETVHGHLLSFGQQQTVLRKRAGEIEWTVVHREEVQGSVSELRSFLFLPKSNTIFLAGSHGALLQSKDEGLTWETVPLQTQASFRSLSSDEKSLLLTGEKLVLLTLAN